MKISVKSSIVTLALLVSTNAYASSAIVTSTINLRVGPGTQYGTIGAIPNGVGITVAGCTSGYDWCQVTYGGMTGWAASSYIAIQTGNGYTTNDNFGSTAAAVGMPLIAGIAIGSALPANSGPYWGPAGVQALIAAGTVAAMSIMAASGVIASRTGTSTPTLDGPSRLERSSGLSSRFWPRPSHASRRQAIKPPLEPHLLTTFCQEHRRIT